MKYNWIYKISLTALFILLLNNFTIAQCRDNMVDCKGHCGNFEDNNKDGFCDFSILSIIKKIEDKKLEDSVIEPNKYVEVKTLPTLPKVVSKRKILPKVNNDTIVTPKVELSISPPAPIVSTLNSEKKKASAKSPYHLWSIVIPLLTLAIVMKFMLVKQIIRNITYTRIWNVFLLFSFMITSIIGILLVVKINYDIQLPHLKYYFIFHVDFGIAMSIISIIHVLWHWKYYYNIIKSK